MAVRIYRPKMSARLTVPVLGTRQERINQAASTSSVVLPLRPYHTRLESNDHNNADRCSVTCDWTQAGVDPRMLDNAVLELFMDNADDFGRWQPSRANCRFVGNVREVVANREIQAPGSVTLECVDYTDLFLNAKPFGSAGIPTYDQTLDAAWRTIVSQTPGAEILADRLRFEGEATGLVVDGLEGTPLGLAVAERFRKFDRVPTKPDTDAWAVWQQCVGMLGLISFIRLDECIVTTATNYYTETDAPQLIWGTNIERWTESRLAQEAGKGVGLTSYDALTRRTLEALWPPIGDTRVRRKRVSAKKAQGEDKTRQNEQREYFAFPGISNLDVLVEIAKRVYEERSRQELEGTATFRDMVFTTESGLEFDALNLHAGDTVSVQALPEHRQLLSSLPNDSQRVRSLTDRGYSQEVATLIVKNMAEFSRLGSKFLVKQAVTELEYYQDGGRFSGEVTYCNRILLDGSTDGSPE